MNKKQQIMVESMTGKQLESMKNNNNFMQFLRILKEKHGNISTKDVKECGLSFEYFLRLSRYKSDDLYSIAAALLVKIG